MLPNKLIPCPSVLQLEITESVDEVNVAITLAANKEINKDFWEQEEEEEEEVLPCVERGLQPPERVIFVRSEVFTAGTVKNDIFWDIKTQFVPHRRHMTCPLQRAAG
jgi:hypothetical protein